MKEKVSAKKETTPKRSAGKVVFVVGGVIVLVLIGALLGALVWQRIASLNAPYSAVAFGNGEIYFGKLTYFPRLALEDVYTIQVVSDDTSPDGTALRLVPLSSAVWAPKKIYINYDNVLFIGKVGEASQVMSAIRQNQNRIQTAPAQIPQQAPQEQN